MAAIAEGTLAPVVTRRRRARARVRGGSSRPRARDWLEYVALRAVFGVLGALPLAVALHVGVLVLSGHFGNWELLVFAHGMRGHPVHMVHRAIANPLVDRWLNALRARAGTKAIRKRQAARAVLAALHAHGLLVLPFDQNSTRGLGVFVDFFGVPASTNAGLARIALRTDAPIVPAFIVREGRSARHRVHVLPLMQVERTGDPRPDVVGTTQRFTAVFEEMVRRYPEQWLWMHKRWKTRPPGEPRLY